MRVSARFLLPALVMLASLAEAQDGGFQLPVQLIGFPVIIMAVRISNFMKKLAYAVNPRTYSQRSRRAAVKGERLHALGGAGGAGAGAPDAAAVEKLLVGEFGERVCVYERVCAQYAQRALDAHGHNALLDWDTVFSRYKSAPAGEKQNYLLSVFLGDMVRSPALCLGLAKRGRSCAAAGAAERSINHLQEHPPATSTARTTSITSSTRSTSSSTSRRRVKPNTHVPARPRPAARHSEEHHHVESHQERHQPARGAPAHRQPAHPPAHPLARTPAHAAAPAHHRLDGHHSEVHRKADHPAQTARRPRPARRRPASSAAAQPED